MSTLAIAFVRSVTAIASRTAGSRSSDGTSRSGTWVKSATSGSARNVSATPAASARRTLNARPAPCAGCMTEAALPARRQPKAEALQHAAPAGGQDLAHDAVRPGRVAARPADDAHLVAHRRLGPGGQADDVEAALRGEVVAEVREAGVGRAEPDLRDDAVDVRLEAHRVAVEDRRELHAPQELTGVGADRHARGPDREAPAARAQAVHRAQAGRVAARGDEDEDVRREGDRPRALALAEQRLRLRRARRGEQVGGRAALDLELELVRAGEVVLRGLVDDGERRAQRGGAVDGDRLRRGGGGEDEGGGERQDEAQVGGSHRVGLLSLSRGSSGW